MSEKKFHIPALVCSILGVLLSFFLFGVEGILAGGIGLGLSIAKRSTHRTRLSLVLSVIAILGGLIWLCWLIYTGSRGMAWHDYWFFRLLFGDPA